MKTGKPIRIIIYALLTLGIMTAIFLLSAQDAGLSASLSDGFLSTRLGRLIARLIPSITGEGTNHDIRKIAHIFEFFCLGVTGTLLFSELCERKRNALSFGLLLGFLYACSDEWHQTFVPGRSGSLSDVCIDSIGVLLGAVSVGVILLSAQRKKAEIDK